LDRKIKNVAVYVRKSRDNNESLEGQLSSILDYCERFNWEYEVFKEEGSASSEDWNRPELQRMIRLVEAQHYDAVVVTEQSRITRADEFPKFRNVLQEANCLFITTQTNSVYDYTKPEDEFVSDIMSAVAKQEIAFAKLRLKRGTIQSAKKGNWLGKKSPTGYIYNRETKRLEPSEDAPIIKRMFELYVNGLSTKDISYKFEFENVITSTNMIWSPAGISRLLNNPVYAGHSLYGRTSQKKVNGKRLTTKTKQEDQILIENTHTPIIDAELWEKVQKIKHNKSTKPVQLKHGKHKFSGLIRCALCGRVHSFQMSHSKKLRICSCQTRFYSEDRSSYTLCKNEGCNVDKFDQEFHEHIVRYANELSNHIELIKNSEDKGKSNTESEIISKKNQIKKIQQDIKRVQQGFTMEIFTAEEAQEQIKRYKQQQGEIEEQLSLLENRESDSKIGYLEMVLEEIRSVIKGEGKLPESKLNSILVKQIDTILYVKQGEEIELHISWKVNYKLDEVAI
jgi:DNA invertase Pin-like site-specific DNA recombinase